jgi:hypothetical protein
MRVYVSLSDLLGIGLCVVFGVGLGCVVLKFKIDEWLRKRNRKRKK